MWPVQLEGGSDMAIKVQEGWQCGYAAEAGVARACS
jgi:hypothetical protein